MIARKAVQWEPKNTSIGLAPSRVKWRVYGEKAAYYLQQSSVKIGFLFLVVIACYVLIAGIRNIDSYQLVETQRTVHSLQKENAELQVDIAKLKSPARIQDIATNQLGMVLPDHFIFSTHHATKQSSQDN